MYELEEWRLLAYESSKLCKEKAKRFHVRRIKHDKQFKEGGQVLSFNSHLILFPSKLKSKWSKPFSL